MALFYSLLLHALIIGMIFSGVIKASRDTKPDVNIKYMSAVLLQKPVLAKETKKASEKKGEPETKSTTKTEKKPQSKNKSKPKPKPKPKKETPPVEKKAVSKPKPQKKLDAKPKPKPTPKRKPKPMFDDSLDSLMSDEDDELVALEEAVTKKADEDRAQFERDQATISEFGRLISEKVSRYWSRPPSARNDMQVMLDISMLPGGEVSNVSVVESSGNPAFDRSALLAVKKARVLPVPSDPVVFNNYFRKMKLNFNPEDLRL